MLIMTIILISDVNRTIVVEMDKSEKDALRRNR